jgi:hypothetical protein
LLLTDDTATFLGRIDTLLLPKRKLKRGTGAPFAHRRSGFRRTVSERRQPRSRAIVRAKRAATASRATCRPSVTTARPAAMTSRTAEAAETNT